MALEYSFEEKYELPWLFSCCASCFSSEEASVAWVVVVPLTADDEDPPLGRVPSIAGSDSLLGVQGRDMMVGSKKKALPPDRVSS